MAVERAQERAKLQEEPAGRRGGDVLEIRSNDFVCRPTNYLIDTGESRI